MNLVLCLLMLFSTIYAINAIHCGFPGRPAYGRALQVADSYSEGQSVHYTCNSGYYMVGTSRRCLPNGTWTGNIPVCDTTLSPIGYTSSSEALSLYPPELAVDGNKRSCFYSNRRKPRWWRMDMGLAQTVISVSITVPFASSEHHFTIYVIVLNGTLTKYHKCASFRGIFSSQTMILSCGNGKGITGSVLHIEDNSPHLDHFGLCEVEVFVRKDYYECGQPEIPTNSFILDKPSHSVTYACLNGYKLEGSYHRSCMKNGQWTGAQPICREINCPKPLSIENGSYRIVAQANNKLALGSKVIYACKPGFNLVGPNATQFCNEDGTWAGTQPECHPIDCGAPLDNSEYLGGKFKLLNSSTKLSAMAELNCFSGKRLGIIIHCRDDGTWTELDATCIYNKVDFYNANISESIGDNNPDISIATILATVIVAVLIVLIALVFLLFKKKIVQFKWSSEPMGRCRRPSWALEALRHTNIQLRKPFRFQANCPTKSHSTTSAPNASVISHSSKLENVYEEIANFASNPINDETEDKIRRAAIIAAELAVINEQKQNQMCQIQQSNPLSRAQTPPIGLYAKVDLIQKHKDRLLREQQRLQELSSAGNAAYDDYSDGSDPNYSDIIRSRLQKSDSSSLLETRSLPIIETIQVNSLDLSMTHVLKDNLIFVGHPGASNCDNLSQVTQSGSNSDVKRIYTITS